MSSGVFIIHDDYLWNNLIMRHIEHIPNPKFLQRYFNIGLIPRPITYWYTTRNWQTTTSQ